VNCFDDADPDLAGDLRQFAFSLHVHNKTVYGKNRAFHEIFITCIVIAESIGFLTGTAFVSGLSGQKQPYISITILYRFLSGLSMDMGKCPVKKV